MIVVIRSFAALALGLAGMIQAAAAAQSGDDVALEDAALVGSTGNAAVKEFEALFLAQGAAARSADRLILRLSGSARRAYANARGCRLGTERPHCSTYAMASYMKSRNLFVLVHTSGTASAYVLVDARNGRETRLDSMPIVSPDGRRVLQFDRRSERPSEVSILRRRATGEFAVEWSGDLETIIGPGTFEFAAWRSPVAVSFERFFWTRDGWAKLVPARDMKSVELHRTGTAWAAREAPPSATPARALWNWRAVYVSASQTSAADPPTESQQAEVLFGRNRLLIKYSPPMSFAGRISRSGTINGISTPLASDDGPSVLRGHYRETPMSLADGNKARCRLREIVLYDAAFSGQPVTVHVQQLPDECLRGSASE